MSYHDDLQQCIEALEAEGYRVLKPDEIDTILDSIDKLTGLVRDMPTDVVTRMMANRTIREYLDSKLFSKLETDGDVIRERELLASDPDPIEPDAAETEPTVAELDYEAETGRKAYDR